jgi:hypothetical protein
MRTQERTKKMQSEIADECSNSQVGVPQTDQWQNVGGGYCFIRPRVSQGPLDMSLMDSNTIHGPMAQIGDAAPWDSSVCQLVP